MVPTPVNTIFLKTRSRVVYDEARVKAGASVTPGMLIALDANGEAAPHAVVGGAHQHRFAGEEDFYGSMNSPSAGRTIDTPYVAGDLCRHQRAEVNYDEIYAWLKDGENVTPDDFLSSAGDGTLKKAVAGENIVAKPLHALNLVGGAAAAGRIGVIAAAGVMV